MDAASLLPFHDTICPKEEIRVCLEHGVSVISEQSASVVVAMSGGVDSSVTAALLAQKVI
jgi:asparagine synthetase B (glutamine-hydrolysing)